MLFYSCVRCVLVYTMCVWDKAFRARVCPSMTFRLEVVGKPGGFLAGRSSALFGLGGFSPLKKYWFIQELKNIAQYVRDIYNSN